MSNRRPWTGRQIRMLIRIYPDSCIKVLEKKLGHPMQSIYQMVKLLGLHRSASFRQRDRYRTSHLGRIIGIEYRFKEGNPGHKAMSNGSITIHGYKDVKTGKFKRYKFIRIGPHHQWKMFHVHAYEKAHGPIPPGYCLTFKDGNSLNCSPDNIECISRVELTARLMEKDTYVAMQLSRTCRPLGSKADEGLKGLIIHDEQLVDISRNLRKLKKEINYHARQD